MKKKLFLIYLFFTYFTLSSCKNEGEISQLDRKEFKNITKKSSEIVIKKSSYSNKNHFSEDLKEKSKDPSLYKSNEKFKEDKKNKRKLLPGITPL